MKYQRMYFVEPLKVELREETLPPPGPGQLVIKTSVSGISAGTELLFYAGLQPRNMALDANLPSLEGSADYPISYGYALAGKIVDVGSGVDASLQGKTAFAFHPHATHALVRVEDAVILPAGMDAEDAIFFPNTETAANLVMDGAPILGERVAVLGLGIIGLLTSAILRQFPLDTLYGIDTSEYRRRMGREAGMDGCFADWESALSGLGHSSKHQGAAAGSAGSADGFDACFELSGNPAALDAAVRLCGFGSRVCVGSWYGTKTYPINLGGDFHRNRIRLFSSQVSTLAPELSGRWTRERRAQSAWNHIEKIRPSKWITHRIPFARCAEAYRMLHSGSEDALQVVLSYD